MACSMLVSSICCPRSWSNFKMCTPPQLPAPGVYFINDCQKNLCNLEEASYRIWTINTDQGTIENTYYLYTDTWESRLLKKNILIACQKRSMNQALDMAALCIDLITKTLSCRQSDPMCFFFFLCCYSVMLGITSPCSIWLNIPSTSNHMQYSLWYMDF